MQNVPGSMKSRLVVALLRAEYLCGVSTEHSSPDIEREVVRRYKAGEPITDIVQACGVASGTVYAIANRHGIKPNRARRAERKNHGFWRYFSMG